jgi:hypothetical protein
MALGVSASEKANSRGKMTAVVCIVFYFVLMGRHDVSPYCFPFVLGEPLFP